jgi:hypothetical protein
VAAEEVSTDPSLSQALHMLNGPTTHQKIQQGGVIQRLLAEDAKPEDVITALFVRTLTRQPAEQELQRLLAIVQEAKNPQLGLEDVFWAILNSREFTFNH